MSEQVHKSSEQVGDKEKKAIEIINKIRDSITDNENVYLLCDSLENIIKNNNQSYDIQLIVSGLLNYIDKLQKENKELKDDQLWSEATIEGLKERFIPKEKVKRIRDKAECEDYYSLIDVIDDLSKLIGDYEEDKE